MSERTVVCLLKMGHFGWACFAPFILLLSFLSLLLFCDKTELNKTVVACLCLLLLLFQKLRTNVTGAIVIMLDLGRPGQDL